MEQSEVTKIYARLNWPLKELQLQSTCCVQAEFHITFLSAFDKKNMKRSEVVEEKARLNSKP